MSPKKDKSEEEFVFEFYDEEFGDFSEEEPYLIEGEYNNVNFEEDLNEEQLEIVDNIRGPMLIIAGAGSGKTRTIVYSVAKLLSLGTKPSEIMLVTFTNKAANEMIKRVEILLGKKPKGIWAGTFHSIANRFLRKYSKTLELKPNYTIMDESDAKALMKLSTDTANVKEVGERFPTSAMSKNILSYTINCNKSIRDVILWKYSQFDNDKVIAKLKEVFNIYRTKKAKDGLLDFDDLLVFWNRLLKEKHVAELIAKRIKYVLVDEYQDTNYLQDEIIYKIVQQNPKRNVMAVGDDAQSIYAFRGANFQNIIKFSDKYKKCRIFKITYNYRSVPEILELANNSILNNKNQYKKEMQYTRSSGSKPFQVNVVDEEEQARFISNQVLELRDKGYELDEMAILFRAASHSLKIEMELKAKNIPYTVRAGLSFFEKAHIKDLIVHLRVIDNPFDELSWFRIFNIVQGLGKASASKILEYILQTKNPIELILKKDFFTGKMRAIRIPAKGINNLTTHVKKVSIFTSGDNPVEVIQEMTAILAEYLKSKYDDWEDRVADLNQLGIYAQKFNSIRQFLEILSLNLSSIESRTVRTGNHQIEENPLVLSTIHRAKGLEWRVVFIPMLCEDSFPSSRVIGDEEAFEEERRVFYVAITRAKDQLYLLSPATVQRFGGHRTARLSQFIEELDSKVYRKAHVHFKSKKSSFKKVKSSDLFISAVDLIPKKKKN